MPLMLIADDNPQIAGILENYAKKEGYEVAVARDGEETLALFRGKKPAVILLDVMMPKLDGYAACAAIRRQSDVPIIMVTAKGEDYERIMGLDTGADDYIVKPFSPGEVMARVRAVLRRVEKTAGGQQVLGFDNLRVDLDDYRVTVAGETVALTKREVELLWTLCSNRTKVFSRENLLDSLWGYDYFGDPRTVDTHIKRLRAKLEVVPHPGWAIKTIWGVGYKFEAVAHNEANEG